MPAVEDAALPGLKMVQKTFYPPQLRKRYFTCKLYLYETVFVFSVETKKHFARDVSSQRA